MLTIAIPTYKRGKYLVSAINSAINQLGTSIEYKVIVVNNDPETNMENLKEKYGSKVTFYTNEKNLGMLGNMNRCIELADTKYIAFLHDDDLLLPNYVSQIEKILLKDEAACIIPERYIFSENGSISFKKKTKSLLSKIFNYKGEEIVKVKVEDNIFSWQNCYNAPTCGIVFEREVLIRTGKFSFEGTLAWDYLSMMKFNKSESVIILKKVLAVYRLSSGVTNKPTTQIDFYNCYESLLDEYLHLDKTKNYISYFYNEIRYLNYSSISDDARNIIASSAKIKFNKIKFLVLQFYRIMYFTTHRLNIENVIDKITIDYIKELERNI